MIKLTEKNREAVQQLLTSTNRWYRQYVWEEAATIYGLAQEAERQLAQLGIAKKRRIGAEYYAESGPGKLPQSYGWSANINVATLIRGPQVWMLEKLSLAKRRPGEQATDFLSLTTAQDEEACRRFRASRYKVLPVAAGGPTIIATEHDQQPGPSRP